MNELIDSLGTKVVKRLEIAEQIKADVLLGVRAEKDMVMAPTDEDTAKYAAEMNKQMDAAAASVGDAYAIASEEGKKILEKIRENLKNAQEIQKDTKKYGSMNSTSHAMDIFHAEGEPAYKAMAATLLALKSNYLTGEPTPERQRVLLAIGDVEALAERVS